MLVVNMFKSRSGLYEALSTCWIVCAMFADVILLSLPFSAPSLYLAYKLYTNGYLGTVFNQNLAFLFITSGESLTRYKGR